MSLITRAASLWRNVFHKQQTEDELGEELRGYVRVLAEEKMRSGMGEREAYRAAHAELGGTEFVKENVRAERSGAWIEGMMQDVRYAIRSLGRARTFTLTAVVALALGIGASTAIFSVVNGVLLRPLSYARPDELVTILHNGHNPVATANFADWRAQTSSFTDMAAADYWSPNVSGSGESERILALHITPNMLPLLGVAPLIGRWLTPDAGERESAHEAVLGYGIWQRRFAGDSAVLGRSIVLDGAPYTVVGVMPPDFGFAPFWAQGAQLWAPMPLQNGSASRNNNSLRVFARLKHGVGLAQARTDIAGVTGRLDAQFPGTNTNVVVTPLMDNVTGGMRRPLTVLLIAVSFLLVAACANVAHMLLARSVARGREMAVRIAIGATRAKLTRQLLCESLLLSLAGGALGVAIAVGGVRALTSLAGRTLARADEVRIDARVLGVTFAISVITGVLFGLAPAFNAARAELVSSLKDGGRSQSGGRAHGRLRHALVASQFAVALTLLIGAGLMMRTLAALHGIDPGFDQEHVISAVVSVAGTSASEPANRAAFYQRVVDRVRALPGVAGASAINHLPLAGDMWKLPVWLDGQPIPAPGKGHGAIYRVVLPGYLGAMGIPLERGRDIDPRDRLDALPVAVVNQRFADHVFPGENPVGKRFTLTDPRDTSARWISIVGVAKNALRNSWVEQPDDEMYLPYLQTKQYLESPGSHVAYLTLVVRTTGSPGGMGPAIRSVVRELNPGAPVSQLQTMAQVVSAATADSQLYFALFTGFAGFALVLAAVGIYGVMSHAVSRRTHEIGLRMALGARATDVRRLVVGQGMRVVIVGAFAGVAGAVGLTRLMDTILYGVRPTDPPTFVFVILFLLGVALVACWIPARRATRIDPLLALRSD